MLTADYPCVPFVGTVPIFAGLALLHTMFSLKSSPSHLDVCPRGLSRCPDVLEFWKNQHIFQSSILRCAYRLITGLKF
jgi:hypothetical protein